MPSTILITGEELMTNANWYNFHFFQKLSNGQKKKKPKVHKTLKQTAAKGTESAHMALMCSVGLAKSTWVREAAAADIGHCNHYRPNKIEGRLQLLTASPPLQLFAKSHCAMSSFIVLEEEDASPSRSRDELPSSSLRGKPHTDK